MKEGIGSFRTRGFFWLSVGLIVFALLTIVAGIWGRGQIQEAASRAYVKGYVDGQAACCCGEAESPSAEWNEGDGELAQK